MFPDKNRYKGNVNFFLAMAKYVGVAVGAYLLFMFFINPYIPWATINHALGIDKIQNPLTGLMSNPDEKPVSMPSPDQPVTIPVTAPTAALNHDQFNSGHYHWIVWHEGGIFDYGLYDASTDSFTMRGGNTLKWNDQMHVYGHLKSNQLEVGKPYIVGPLPNNALYLNGNLMQDGEYIIATFNGCADGCDFTILQTNMQISTATAHFPWVHGAFPYEP